MEFNKVFLTLVAGFMIVGCSEGQYSGLSKAELAEKKAHCDSVPKKSAVFANGCEQIDKEVAVRKAKK